VYKATIFGVKGLELTSEEKNFFSKEKPIGFILFSRNIQDKKQLKSLVDSLRHTIENPKAPILIDQEGGRVSRLKEPNWFHPPAAAIFGTIALQNLEDAKEAAKLNAQIMGHELNEMGINVDCAPVVDIPSKDSNQVIGDRAFGDNITIATELAQAMIDGLNSKGISHIIKHIPGHGRALLDSHFELPHVNAKFSILNESDFVPFKKLNNADWAMTAHIIYEDIDPDHPATLSTKVIDIVRNEIGFKGIIITDCLTMKALKGKSEENARDAFSAGCDLIIFSRPKIEEMDAIIQQSPILNQKQIDIIEKNHPITETADIMELMGRLNGIFKEYGISPCPTGIDPTEQHFEL
jgi:beta-N-acetylhexosaminidase